MRTLRGIPRAHRGEKSEARQERKNKASLAA